MSDTGPLTAADERVHPVDPAAWSWSESWFFSWIDLDGGPAGFFRVGVLPNQGRAMLWSFLHVGGQWLGVEESRLAFDDLDLDDGVAYDRWGLRFGWRPDPPLEGARFTFAADALARSGADAGAYVPVSVDLRCTATGRAVRTGSGDDDERSAHETGRLEQPLEASGTVVVGGRRHDVTAGAHRDRSWGPREWRQMFTLGDLQSPGRQLYFVARTLPGLGMALVRDREGLRDGEDVRHMIVADGSIDFDDEGRTIREAWIRAEEPGSEPLEITMRPIAPSVVFDMAHTCEVPERWLYWRTLVEAEVPGWGGPCRGWFETSRYGVA